MVNTRQGFGPKAELRVARCLRVVEVAAATRETKNQNRTGTLNCHLAAFAARVLLTVECGEKLALSSSCGLIGDWSCQSCLTLKVALCMAPQSGGDADTEQRCERINEL
jgi:hypothetical protein